MEQQTLFGQENERYTVLARKYRPSILSDIVSQPVFVNIVRNSFKYNKIPNVWLLTGIRGVGKTTAARIIAKLLNCSSLTPDFDPCDKCSHCVSINSGRDADVMEIDAASNTSVDNIRDIIENSVYKPVSCKYKVYIIDEVHMLSINAFNALLKIIEEPPEYVKFIFATTEAHKVPSTIISRSQRFNLKRFSNDDLAEYLARVCRQEGYEAEAEAVNLIAEAAFGSLRDGLSILDQALSGLSEKKLTEAAVKEMLSVLPESKLHALLDGVISGDVKSALDLLKSFYMDGYDPSAVVEGMIKLVYDAMMNRYKSSGDTSGDTSEHAVDNIGIDVLLYFWDILNKGLQDIKAISNSIKALDILIVKMVHIRSICDNDEDTSNVEDENDGSDNMKENKWEREAKVSNYTPVFEMADTNVLHTSVLQKVMNTMINRNEFVLCKHVMEHLKILHIEEGYIVCSVDSKNRIAVGVPNKLKAFLDEATQIPWKIVCKPNQNAASVEEIQAKHAEILEGIVSKDKMVENVLKHFTTLEISDIMDPNRFQ